MNRRGAPYVYFVRAADGSGPVKIGCSEAPTNRLSSLMAWAPFPLEIVATIPGDESIERRFHAMFKHLWSHREWFRSAPDLTLALAELAAGSFDIGRLPERGWRPASKKSGTKWTLKQRLLMRLGSLRNRAGICSPGLLRRVEGMDKLDGAAQAALSAEVLAHLADPLRSGELLPYDWARAAYSRYAAKHGWPPLVIAAAA